MLTKRKCFGRQFTLMGMAVIHTWTRRLVLLAVLSLGGSALARPPMLIPTPRPDPLARDYSAVHSGSTGVAVTPIPRPDREEQVAGVLGSDRIGPTPSPRPSRAEQMQDAEPSAGPPAPPLANIVAPATADEPVVLAARVGQDGQRTRFVVELSDPIKVHIFTLANPDRLVIDMPQVLWKLNGPPRHGRGAVRTWRYGLFRPGNARFVLDLKRPIRLAEPLVLPPEDGYGYRLVLDMYPTSQAAFNKTAGWPADLRAREEAAAMLAAMAPRPAVRPRRQAARSRRKVIVIDPGHGGIDSGTIGVTGLEEKNVVLAVGLKLARLLRARGYKVFMTRSSDVFIPLYQRAPFARRHHADLMISLHADSNPDPRVAGASIYTLSEKGSNREAAALARKENRSDIIAGIDLPKDDTSVASILIDLAQRDTMNQSISFAHTALHELTKATDILSPDPERSANFVVLRSPVVPSV
ncbi:MAG: N-acetylmuramoyl-L-alanine amidase, partial [Alphaproteobacteria bacterium]|nr:N-acetylmuramoyl-L-alanine amidase [Alphaproteobacteria bacterium]